MSGVKMLASDRLPGCYNREMAAGYWVKDRQYTPSGQYNLVYYYVPHQMTTDCKWSETHTDPACKGCQHNKGEQHESTEA